jgi:hypothetical protein
MVEKDGGTDFGPAFTVPIEFGKVREFATATKARSTRWEWDDSAVTMPTFLATILFWASGDSLPYIRQGFAAERTLHGGREYTFYGPPPRVGDRLTGRQRVERIYTKQGRRGGQMRFVVALTEFRNQADELVAEMRNTTIETGRPVAEDGQ